MKFFRTRPGLKNTAATLTTPWPLSMTRLKDVTEEDFASVYLGEGMKHLAILGGDTFMNEWLAAAHCKNASYDILTAGGKEDGLHSGFREISMEQVLASDPEIIIINEGSPADLTDDARWNEISAVKNGRVYIGSRRTLLSGAGRLSSRLCYILSGLQAMFIRSTFEDFSLEDEYIRFYKELFDFEVNEKTAQAVISGAVTANFNPVLI